MKMKKILLTGGHAGSTAYALSQTIREKDPECEIVFAGSRSAVEGRIIATLENTYLPKMGIRYISVIAGRLQRKFTIWTLPSLARIPLGFFHALIILLKERPSITVSFGGFAAFPIVVVSRLLHIPVILHEQTVAAGRANIASGYFADKIALAHKESRKYFPKEKCIITGNPISKEVIACVKKKNSKRKRAILIAGGSRGSYAINESVKEIIPRLAKIYKIYHQTGTASFEEFRMVRESMNTEVRKNYNPFATSEMWNWSKYLDRSDLLVSRSGANIVSEAVYLGIPSIFIPLPNSFKNEQLGNANYARSLGLAAIIDQKKLNTNILYKEIKRIYDNWESIVKKSKIPPIDDSKAGEKLYTLISLYGDKT